MDVDGLQVKIGADTSGLEDAAGKVKSAADKMGDSLKQGAQKGESGMNSLKDSMGELLPAMGVAALVAGAAEFGKAIFEAGNKHTKAIVDLGSALKLDGVKNVDAFTKKEDEFAASLQDSTNLAKDDTLALLAHAAAMGIQPEKLNDTILAAQGLAKVTGGDASQAMRMLTMASEGNFNMLQRQLPLLKGMQDAHEKYAYVMRVSQGGLNTLNEETRVGEGPSKKLSLAWEDIQEKLNQFLPTLIDVAKVLKDVVVIGLEPFIAAIKISLGGVKALNDFFHGDFKKGIATFADSIKSSATGIVGAYKDLGTDAYAAYNQAFTDANKKEETKAPVFDVSKVGAGGGGNQISESVEKFKDLTTIIHEAYQAMDIFGKTRPEALKKELSEIQSSMDKITDLGDKATTKDIASYNELAKAAAKVKGDIDRLNNSIDASNDDKGSTGGLLQITDALQKIQDVSDQAVSHMKAFGDTKFDALKTEINEVKKAMEEAFAAKNTQGFDILKAKLGELEEAETQAKIEADAFKTHVEQMGQTSSEVGGQVGNMIGQLANNKGKDIGQILLGDTMKMIGDAAKKFGEKMIGLGTAEMIATAGASGEMQIVGGGAIVAAGTALGALKLAQGGIVHGSTIANVGEYAGANHNPEVVAPLSKLQGMLGKSSGGGALTAHVSGSGLLFVLNEELKNQGFASTGQGLQQY